MVFVRDYFDYLDGRYDFHRLFAFHNEHRILTSRPLYFIDAHYFAMSNDFLVTISYATLLAIASWFAWAAAGRLMFVALPIFVGHLGNGAVGKPLVGFRNPIPTCQLVAIGGLGALASSLISQHVLHRYCLLVLACAFDFLCVFSLASGLFLAASAITLGVCLRRLNGTLLLFLAFHGVCALLYLRGFNTQDGNAGSFNAVSFTLFTLHFLGGAFRGWRGTTAYAGAILLSVSLTFGVIAIWRAWIARDPLSTVAAVAISLIPFVLLQAVAAAATRSSMGIMQAVVPRYATPAIFLLCALLLVGWVLASEARRWRRLSQSALIACAIICLIGANAPYNEFEWELYVRRLDAPIFAIVNGARPDEFLRIVYSDPEFSALLDRIQKLPELARFPRVPISTNRR